MAELASHYRKGLSKTNVKRQQEPFAAHHRHFDPDHFSGIAYTHATFDLETPESYRRTRIGGYDIDVLNKFRNIESPSFVYRLSTDLREHKVEYQLPKCAQSVKRKKEEQEPSPESKDCRLLRKRTKRLKPDTITHYSKKAESRAITGKVDFMKFPVEIRDMIYGYVLATESPNRSKVTFHSPPEQRYRSYPQEKVECYSVLNLISKTIRSEVLELTRKLPRTLVFDNLSDFHLQKLLPKLKMVPGRLEATTLVLNYTDRAYDFSKRLDKRMPQIIPQTIETFINIAKSMKNLKLITFHYHIQKSERGPKKKEYVDINCNSPFQLKQVPGLKPGTTIATWEDQVRFVLAFHHTHEGWPKDEIIFIRYGCGCGGAVALVKPDWRYYLDKDVPATRSKKDVWWNPTFIIDSHADWEYWKKCVPAWQTQETSTRDEYEKWAASVAKNKLRKAAGEKPRLTAPKPFHNGIEELFTL